MRKTPLGLAGLIAFTAFVPRATPAQQLGDLQVTCEAGVRIYVDGRFMGVTSDSEDGLYVSGLPAGGRAVRAEKEGFEPKTFRVVVQARRAVELRIDAFGPAVRVMEEGIPTRSELKAQTGSLWINTIPLSATIEFLGREIAKEGDLVKFDDVQVGRHVISFTRGSQRLTHHFTLGQHEIVRLRVDFRDGTIQEWLEATPVVLVRMYLRPGAAFLKNAALLVDGTEVFRSMGDELFGYGSFWPSGGAEIRSGGYTLLEPDSTEFDSYVELYLAEVSPGRHTWAFEFLGGRQDTNLDDVCARRYGLTVDPTAEYPYNRPHKWNSQRTRLTGTLDVEAGTRHTVHIAPYDMADEEAECRVGRWIGISYISHTVVGRSVDVDLLPSTRRR